MLLSKRVADGLRGASGFWKHGHTYQAHPIACAAALAVQKVIVEERLLENVGVVGPHLGALLRSRLTGPNARAAPYVWDIRGGGAWWAVEFDFTTGEKAVQSGYEGKTFALDVQARALENGLVIMGFTGGSSLDGLKGNHCMFSPAYNVTKEEVEKIVDIFIKSVEEVLDANGL